MHVTCVMDLHFIFSWTENDECTLNQLLQRVDFFHAYKVYREPQTPIDLSHFELAF